MQKTKLLLLMILFVMGAKSTFGQNMLSPFVISSTGGFYTDPSGTFSATVGEMAMVETFHANIFLTQGFQQPVPDSTDVGVAEITNAEININIFPNPAINYLSVNIRADNSKLYHIRITDIVGKEILSSVGSPLANGVYYNMDVSNFAKGIYLMTVQSEDKKINKTIQFEKN